MRTGRRPGSLARRLLRVGFTPSPSYAGEPGLLWRSPLTWLLLLGFFVWAAACTASALEASATLRGHPGEALRYGVPLALCALALLGPERPDPRLRTLAAASALLSAALFAVPHAVSSTTISVGVPGVLLTASLVSRLPQVAILVSFGLTASFGSLAAFTSIPTGVISTLLLLSLWAGVVWRHAFDEHRGALHVSPAFALIWAYVLLTFADILAGGDLRGSLEAFRTSGFYLTVALLIAMAGWEPPRREQIARGIVLIALLVGAYAVLRIVIGPSSAERGLAGSSPFDFVQGKLKPAGSLGNGTSLAVWTAALIPFCAALALALKGAWRVAAVGAVALCGIALVGAQLRTGVVAVTVGLLVVIALVPGARAFPGLRLGPAISAIALAVGTALIAVAIAAGPNPATRSYSAIFHPGSDPSVSARAYKWGRAFKEIDQHPLGQGIGSATSGFSGDKLASSAESVGIGSQSIDSGYLKIALEQGFPVLAIYVLALLALIGSTARHALTAEKRLSSSIALAATGSVASFAVLLLTGAFSEGLPALAVWIAAGLGLAEVTSRTASAEDRSGQLRSVAIPPLQPAPQEGHLSSALPRPR